MAFRIRLEKENFKFSCSHFTIFGPSRAEALHGHNYYVSVELKLASLDPKLGMAFDFNLVKPLVRAVADRLDERVLVPENSPYLTIQKSADRIVATYGAKKYDLPAADVILLPVVNVTSEELARHFADELLKGLAPHPESLARVESVTVGIEETRGQSVYYDLILRLPGG
ncbi:MAG: 6-carboxytetrahydropterin synthase [Bdellovibrionota bacterium]